VETIKGYVERIIFRNNENGYTVLDLETDKDDVICVGIFDRVNEGSYLELKGEFTVHKTHGEQFKVSSFSVTVPENEEAIKRYLGSGAIKGIGEKLAERIVKKFGKDTFRIIDEEPHRLAEIKGISDRKANEIASQIEEEKDMRQAMLYLQDLGVSASLSIKIYNTYRQRVYTVLKTNPYQLATDISGVGFKMADEIAAKAGISPFSEHRIKCALLYVLLRMSNSGNVYVPKEELIKNAKDLLSCDESMIEEAITSLAFEKQIIIKAEGEQVYYANYYYTELKIARLLSELNLKEKLNDEEIKKSVKLVERKIQIELDELQRHAVCEAVKSGLLIITGGPGTGKTTTINTIIKYFELQGMKIALAAPTGRAAKRMSEATGKEAKTIHRLLEVNGEFDSSKESAYFERNADNPLEEDVIIIDEMSMVDIFLMKALLQAVIPGTRLILVGDVDQLPSVGAGCVLKDIIDSKAFNVVKLTKIFRQAGESEIVVNAHKINRGERVKLRPDSKDFIYIKREEANAVLNAMLTLVKEKLPSYVNADMFDIQILTPMKRGALGVENINEVMQNYLNPKEFGKKEIEREGTVFREGDKVMHIKNNYQLEWECRGKYGIPYDSGIGVFNGETGIIRKIDEYLRELEVEFDENKFVKYPFALLEELELAYAITVHKSQGSEYPAVILPMLMGPKMLMNRNILYTAITRAKTCVCVVGSDDIFNLMVANVNETKRYSGLKDRITEIESIGKEGL